MPGLSGLRVCEEIRKISSVPILFLTAKAQESDKLIGLTAGGDDYLTKPFSYTELAAREKALLRRYCVYRGKTDDASISRNNVLSLQDIIQILSVYRRDLRLVQYRQMYICWRSIKKSMIWFGRLAECICVTAMIL